MKFRTSRVFAVATIAFFLFGCVHTRTVDLSQTDREPAAAASGNLFGTENPVSQVNWRAVFAELIAKNIRQNIGNDEKAAQLASRSMYYADQGFQQTSQAILNSRSSEEAFVKRETILGMTRQKYAGLFQGQTLKSLPTTDLVSVLMTPQQPTTNYFDSAHGRAVSQA